MPKPVHDQRIDIRAWQAAAGKGDNAGKSDNLNHDQFDDFSLPPEKEAYYAGQAAGAEHRAKLATIKGAEAKANYTKGLREGITADDVPKRGDINNPRKKDMPKPPAQPRQPRQPAAGSQVRNAQRTAKRFSALARMAGGKKRW